MVDEAEVKKHRNRNPLVPAISLKKALDRARALYDNESRKSMHLDTASKHWGYSSKSSGAQQSISALKQFGLLEEEKVGSVRKLQLSELALRILLDKREDSKERLSALRQAALRPKVYAELWAKADECGDLPSDTELEHYLVLERKQPFYEDAVKGLIRTFKSTIALANIVDNDIMADEGGGGEPADPNDIIDKIRKPLGDGTRRRAVKTGTRQDVFSMDEGEAVLEWPSDLSAESFTDLKDWLEIALRKIGRSVSSLPTPDQSNNQDLSE